MKLLIYPEDVDILSIYLQDAIIPVNEMTYLQEQSSFVGVFNRFIWEAVESGSYERICCGVTVEGVQGMRGRGFDMKDSKLVLDLLTVLMTDKGLDFIFAGGGELYLEASEWRCYLEDFGQPWPTTYCPRHD